MEERASTDVKLSFGRQISAAIGDLGYNMIYCWVAMFITIYYTDVVGVKAFAVSGLLLGVRIFDALNDPLMGMVCDRTRSRFGRYRPWVILGGVLMSIVIVFLFNANPDWDYNKKVVWMYVFYILMTMAATVCYVSYFGMVSVLTSNPKERGGVAAKRIVFCNIASGIFGMAALPLITKLGGSNEQMGYFWAVIVGCCIGLPIIIVSAVTSKEVIKPVRREEKIPFRAMMRAVVRNRPFCIVCLGFFVLGFAGYGRATMYTYYFKYYVGNYGLYSVYSLVNMIGAVVGAVIASGLARKINY